MQRRHILGPVVALLLPGSVLSSACRASDEPPTAAPVADGAATPAAEAAVDAARIEGRGFVARAAPDDERGAGPVGIDSGALSVEGTRLARVDARLLDLQAAVNQLDVTGADRSECELHWEELDARRAALRREEQSLDDEVTASDRDERRRTLAEDLDDLESDLEAAIQEVESRLSRG